MSSSTRSKTKKLTPLPPTRRRFPVIVISSVLAAGFLFLGIQWYVGLLPGSKSKAESATTETDTSGTTAQTETASTFFQQLLETWETSRDQLISDERAQTAKNLYRDNAGFSVIQNSDLNLFQQHINSIQILDPVLNFPSNMHPDDIFLVFAALWNKTGGILGLQSKLNTEKQDGIFIERSIAKPEFVLINPPKPTDKPLILQMKFFDRGGQTIRFIDNQFADTAMSSNDTQCQILGELSQRQYDFLVEHQLNCEIRFMVLQQLNTFVTSLLNQGGAVLALYPNMSSEQKELLRRMTQTTGEEYTDFDSAFRIVLPAGFVANSWQVCSMMYAVGLGGVVEYCYPEPEEQLPEITVTVPSE